MTRASVVGCVFTLLTLSTFYFAGWLLFGAALEPGGAGWALTLLYFLATIAGKLVPLVYNRLPPLLGMLLVGLLLRNVPGGAIDASIPLLGQSFDWWSRWLRAAALSVIMLRAGLGLDLDKLRKLGFATMRLAFLPCLAEALTVRGVRISEVEAAGHDPCRWRVGGTALNARPTTGRRRVAVVGARRVTTHIPSGGADSGRLAWEQLRVQLRTPPNQMPLLQLLLLELLLLQLLLRQPLERVRLRTLTRNLFRAPPTNNSF